MTLLSLNSSSAEPTFQPQNPNSVAETGNSEVTRNDLVMETTIESLGNDLLVVSPYSEIPHLLNLRTLDTANRLLAKALVGLKCLRPDYATAPYIDSFNWSEVIDRLQAEAVASTYNWEEQHFYIVVFRSQIPPTTRYADLGALDKAAHAEATQSGGFLKYWFGTPDVSGRNLATCVWRSMHDARVGSVGPSHRDAAGAARALYTEWRIERLKLTISNGVRDWRIREWID